MTRHLKTTFYQLIHCKNNINATSLCILTMQLLSIDKSSDVCIKLFFNKDHKIIVKISEQQNCCEVFGMYVMCKNISVKDTLEKYIGKELINVDLIFNECEYKYNECDEFGSYRNYSYLNDPNGIFHHFPNEDKDQIIGKRFDDIDKRVAFNLDKNSVNICIRNVYCKSSCIKGIKGKLRIFLFFTK